MKAWTNAMAVVVNTLLSIPLLVPVVIILAGVAVGWVIEFVILRRVERLTRRTGWHGDDVLIRALQFKVVFWGALLGVYLAIPYSPWPFNKTTLAITHQTLLVLFIITLTFALASASAGFITGVTRPDTRPALSLVTNVAQAAIFAVGFLVILAIFSISITPALAALGVGGLAVSLALQATLTDLISGIQIIAAKQIQPGNYIKLSTGEEGYVIDINWRTTTVRQLSNNMVIIPNSHLTTSILVNYHAPEAPMAVIIPVNVSYESDVDEVERITRDVAREVQGSVAGAVTDFEPLLRYNDFSEVSISLNVILRVHEYSDQFLIKHEFIKRLRQRYMEEGILVPLPSRVVYLKEAHSVRPIERITLPHSSAVRD